MTVAEENQNPEPTLRDVLSLKKQCSSSLSLLTEQVQAICEDVSLICDDLHKVRECTTALENRVSDIEDMAPLLATEMKNAIRRLNIIDIKVEGLENCIRRNYVRVVGILKKAEGNDPVHVAEHWLMDIFGKEHFSPLFAVEHAHRVPTRHLLPGNSGHFEYVS